MTLPNDSQPIEMTHDTPILPTPVKRVVGEPTNNLEDVVERLRTAFNQLKSGMRRTLEDMRDFGRALSEAKRKVPHGAYGDLIREEFGMSVRSAQRYVKLSDEWDKIVAWIDEDEGDITLDTLTLTGALELIAKSAEPDEYFEEHRPKAGLPTSPALLEVESKQIGDVGTLPSDPRIIVDGDWDSSFGERQAACSAAVQDVHEHLKTIREATTALETNTDSSVQASIVCIEEAVNLVEGVLEFLGEALEFDATEDSDEE